ncbi:MAG: hypothetical protein GXO71_04095 [Caldiserica bacterium]|nr:hypothetical protein [Caldisericota bacterium]
MDRIKEITGGKGADRVILACGSDRAQALELVAPLGSVNFFGGLPRGKLLALNTNSLHYKECYAVETHGSIEDLTHRLPLEELQKGLQVVEKGEGLKVIIKPE